jgi:hypothetical protein
MGNNDRLHKERNGNAKGSRVVRLSDAIAGGSQAGRVVSWGDVEPSGIVAVTAAVSALGGAVTYGGSRSRDALQVTIFLDGEKFTWWASSIDEANNGLANIWEKLQTLT